MICMYPKSNANKNVLCWGGTGDLYIYINDTNGNSHLARIPNEANWDANSTWIKVDEVTAYDSSGNKMEKVITEVG